jgi:hypothetical protein
LADLVESLDAPVVRLPVAAPVKRKAAFA